MQYNPSTMPYNYPTTARFPLGARVVVAPEAVARSGYTPTAGQTYGGQVVTVETYPDSDGDVLVRGADAGSAYVLPRYLARVEDVTPPAPVAAPAFVVGDRVDVAHDAVRFGGHPAACAGMSGCTVDMTIDADGDVHVEGPGGALGGYVLPRYLTRVPATLEDDDPVTADAPDAPETSTAPDALAEITALLESTRRERDTYRDEARSWESRTRAARREHEADVATIGEALLEEANNRGWCDVFDTVVDSLNNRLHVALPTRTETYTVRVVIEDEDGNEVNETSLTVGEYPDSSDALNEVVSVLNSSGIY